MQTKRHFFPRIILLGSLLNLIAAPLVYAANDGAMGRGTAYALGGLGIVVLGLAVYLLLVILYPERF
ncbi:potassium-transporting ATPase subunit F [Gloeomargarita lithophora]|uniref:potassium-transporting ATPase subunit F n=1 Tax=Gloeomargarita lithophora TaxID=1188228 RepID=UPI0008F86CC1|nr:potassium-transporting ATPase subunit F [Gloeomargarita lithophora]